MKAFRMLLLLISCLLWLGCNFNDNGRYVVYKVADNHKAFHHWLTGNDDSTQSFLKHLLMGKQFIITFKGNYVTISTSSGPMQLILAKDIDRDKQIYYHEEVSKSGITFTFRLKKDDQDGVLMDVDLTRDKDAVLISPVQVGGSLTPFYEARTVCYLEKIN